MAAESTTTTAAEFMLSEVLSRFVADVGYEQDNVRPLIRFGDISEEPTLTMDFSKWNDLSAAPATLTEATDMGAITAGNTAINPTERSATAVEVGFKIVLTDLLLTSSIFRNLLPYAMQMGMAMGVKISTDILAEVADFSTSVGTTGVDLTEANILSAIYELDGASVMQDVPLVGILHAIQLHDFRTDLAASTGVVHQRDDFMSVAGRGINYLGIPFIRNNTCASVNSNADRQGVLMPTGDLSGLAYVEKWDVTTEPERDASMRGVELVITAAYGDECVEVETKAGVAIITDHE